MLKSERLIRASLEYVPHALMRAIEALGVHVVELAHTLREGGLGRFNTNCLKINLPDAVV
jgi:hypothetical protein